MGYPAEGAYTAKNVQRRKKKNVKQKENVFRSLLTKELRKNCALIRAIETGETTEAFPDVYYCHEGIVLLIECKQQEGIVGPSFTRKIPFRPGQHSFLERNDKKGGNSMIAIKYANCCLFADISAIDDEDHLKEDGAWISFEKSAFKAETLIEWIGKTFIGRTAKQNGKPCIITL